MDYRNNGIYALVVLFAAAALLAVPVVSLAQAGNGSGMEGVTPVTPKALVANAGPDQNPDEDTLVTFDGSGSSDTVGVTHYWWNFTDGTPQALTLVGPTYTFATPGVFNVTLTVGNALGERATDYVIITVKDVTAPVANAGADQNIVVYGRALFDGAASTDNGVIAGYWWNFTDGVAKTLTGITPEYAFANASTYTVTLEVVDSYANKHTDTVDIVVAADVTKPEVVVANMNVDEDAAFNFDSSACTDDGAILAYWWNNTAGGAPQLTGAAPAYTFATPGVYSINLTVRDGGLNYNWTVFTVTVADATNPVAVAGADIVTDEDVLVWFNGTTSTDNVGITVYTWTFDDGGAQTLTGALVNYTFANVGAYNVTLTVEDAAGNTGTDMLVVTVEDATGPTGTLVGAPVSPVDQGVEVNFTATMTDNVSDAVNITYEWFVDGAVQTGETGTWFVYNFTDAGTIVVSVEATDEAGNVGVKALTYTVNDLTAPTVAVAGTPASPVDMGAWVNFTATASDNLSDLANLTYEWYIGTVLQAGETNASFNHTFAIPGTYLITVEVTDEAGLVGTDNVTYVVVDTVDPVANAGADISVDFGADVVFDGSGSTDNVGIVTYAWSWPIISSATGVSPTVQFTILGIYNVTLTVTDAAGNSATDLFVVNVTDQSAPVADAGIDQTVPQGTAVDFDASASDDNVAITNYTWTFVDGANVTLYGVDPTHTFDNIGVFEVNLTVTDATGHSSYDLVEVNVTDGIDPVADAGAAVTGYLAPDEYVMHFDASASDDNVGIANYTWTFVFGTKVVQVVNATTNATENVTVDNVVTLYEVFADYAFDVVGTYTVTLTVADDAGNTGTDTVVVTVAADTTAPASSATAIAVYWDADGTLTVAATATDAHSGVASVALYVATSTDNATFGTYAMTGTADTAAPYSWTYTMAADGFYRFYTIATDLAGNVEAAPAAADAVAGYDNTDPTATIAADLEAVEEGATVTFTVTTADNLGTPAVTVVITDADGVVATLTGAAPTYDFADAGTYTVTVTATDAAGNTATDTVEITVTAPEEEEGSLLWLWILIIVIIVVIVVVVVVVLMMGKKGDGAAPEGEQPKTDEPKTE